MMGNRGGRLHRDDRTLTGRRWTSRRWIVCVCAFKGRRREVWGRGYTRTLFSRRADRARRGPPALLRVPARGGEGLSRRLSRAPERRGPDGRSAASRAGREPAKRVWRARLGDLPEGAMIARERARLRRALRNALAMELRRLWGAAAARAGRRRRRADPAVDGRRARGRLSSDVGGSAERIALTAVAVSDLIRRPLRPK